MSKFLYAKNKMIKCNKVNTFYVTQIKLVYYNNLKRRVNFKIRRISEARYFEAQIIYFCFLLIQKLLFIP